MKDFSNQISDRDPDRQVEITDIRVHVVKGNFEWNLIEIETDAGVTGLGEAYRGGGVPELVAYMKRFLIGENLLDIQRMYKRIL